MRRHQLLSRNQEGAAVIVVAVSMLVLMGFAALVVDFGAGFNERAQDQSASDSAALAAALFTQNRSFGTAVADATTEAIRISYETVKPDGIDLAQWQAEFAACTDPARPAEYSVTGTSDCVSFTANLQRVRVRIPDRVLATTFGRVIGFGSVTTSAFTETITDIGAAGDVLPFGLPTGSAGDSHICLKSNSNGKPDTVEPCDGPTTGNFGFLSITHFGNETMETTTDCNGDNAMIARNIAIGVDHTLVEFNTGQGDDVAICKDKDGTNFSAHPDEIWGETGNKTGVLDNGLIEGVGKQGSGTFPGRLTLSAPLSYFSKTTVVTGEPKLDDTPLWAYIGPDGDPNRPALCLKSSFGSSAPNVDHDGLPTPPVPAQSWEHMEGCLKAFAAASSDADPSNDPDPLFSRDSDGDPKNRTYDIQRSPRWGFVPQLTSPIFQNGTKLYKISRFRAVFIQNLLFSCNANSCTAISSPGESGTGIPVNGNKKVDAITAFLLTDEMLPAEVVEDIPGTHGSSALSIYR